MSLVLGALEEEGHIEAENRQIFTDVEPSSRAFHDVRSRVFPVKLVITVTAIEAQPDPGGEVGGTLYFQLDQAAAVRVSRVLDDRRSVSHDR